jgi:hypothetical protein
MYTQTGHEKYSRTVDKYKRTDSNNEFRSRHVFLLDFLREVSGDPGVDYVSEIVAGKQSVFLGFSQTAPELLKYNHLFPSDLEHPLQNVQFTPVLYKVVRYANEHR